MLCTYEKVRLEREPFYVPDGYCGECRQRPVAHHTNGYAFERGMCSVCGRRLRRDIRDFDRRRLEAKRRSEKAAKPSDSTLPRYVTWRGWVIGYVGTEKGRQYQWGPFRHFCADGLEKLPKRGVLDINAYCDGWRRDDIKALKRMFKDFYADGRGQLPDVRPKSRARP